MRMILIAAAAGLASFGAAFAQPSSLPTYVEAGLDWKVRPKQKDMDRHYPMRAVAKKVMRGYAKVACTPDARGRLDCDVLEEAPAGVFFGQSAVRVMERAEVRAVDGASPEGRTFAYGLRFGNWTARDLPDEYHPASDLRWASMPRLGGAWNLSGQDKGEIFSTRFDCAARADGSLDCTVRDANATRPFVEAALASMEKARVERIGGGSPAGRRFEWTMAVMRTSNCAGGRHTTSGEKIATTGSEAAEMASVYGFNPSASSDINNLSGSGTQPGGYTFSALPRCRPSFLHVREQAR